MKAKLLGLACLVLSAAARADSSHLNWLAPRTIPQSVVEELLKLPKS